MQLSAAEYHAAGRRAHRPGQATVRGFRPACRARAGHQWLQGIQPGRRGAACGSRRLPGFIQARAGAAPDPARRGTGRDEVPARGYRAAPGRAQTRHRRQLSGRLGDHDAVGPRARTGLHDRHRRRTAFLLGRYRGQEPDALSGRADRRQLDFGADRRRRRRHFRRRQPGLELRKPQSGQYPGRQALPALRQRRYRGRALPGLRALVGRLLPALARGNRRADLGAVHRQQVDPGPHPRRRGFADRPARDPRADCRHRQRGRQHHPHRRRR